MVLSGEITDSKTVAAVLKVKALRDAGPVLNSFNTRSTENGSPLFCPDRTAAPCGGICRLGKGAFRNERCFLHLPGHKMSAEPREPRQGLHALHWEMPAGRRAAELLFFNAVAPLSGTGRGLTYQGLCTACAGGGAALHGGPAAGGRGADAISAAGNLRTSTGYFFQAMRPLFTRAAAGGIVGMKTAAGYFPAAVFLCGKSYFCITAPSFAPDTSFA